MRLHPSLMLLLALLGVFPAWAQTGPLTVEYALVHSTRPPTKKLLEGATWSKEIASGQHKVMERGSSPATWNEETYTFMGRKLPITYYDPRAEASQVQYTDVGFKIDCTPRSLNGGLIRMDVRIEKSYLVEDGTASHTYIAESTIILKRGQTAILATTRGVMTSTYLSAAYPELPLGEDASVMLTVTVK